MKEYVSIILAFTVPLTGLLAYYLSNRSLKNNREKEIDSKLNGITEILSELVAFQKSSTYRDRARAELLTNANKTLTANSMLKNSELKGWLSNGINQSAQFFDRLITLNLFDKNTVLTKEQIYNDLISTFKLLLSQVNDNKLCCHDDFMHKLKDVVIIPEINNYITKLDMILTGVLNGKSKDKFIVFNTQLVDNIIKKTINLYVELQQNEYKKAV